MKELLVDARLHLFGLFAMIAFVMVNPGAIDATRAIGGKTSEALDSVGETAGVLIYGARDPDRPAAPTTLVADSWSRRGR